MLHIQLIIHHAQSVVHSASVIFVFSGTI